MARRKQKNAMGMKSTLGILGILGASWLTVRAVKALPRGSGHAFVTAGLLVAAVCLAWHLIRFATRMAAKQGLFLKARWESEQQLQSLLRRRAQLVTPDHYGKPQMEKWDKEIDYFIREHIQPALTPNERKALDRSHGDVVTMIDEVVETALGTQPEITGFSDDLTPAEFEVYCADQLRLCGWDARVTMPGRDQGVDVTAEKHGCRIVLQCKLHAPGGQQGRAGSRSRAIARTSRLWHCRVKQPLYQSRRTARGDKCNPVAASPRPYQY